MSLNDLYLIVAIVIAVGGAIWGVTRVLNTALRNRREARDSRVSKRLEFLREQMALLQQAAADYEKTVGLTHEFGTRLPALSKAREARAMARSAMQTVGNSDLNAIADRLAIENVDDKSDLKAIGDGIKRLAELIADETKK